MRGRLGVIANAFIGAGSEPYAPAIAADVRSIGLGSRFGGFSRVAMRALTSGEEESGQEKLE